jgi:hypothetical protein
MLIHLFKSDPDPDLYKFRTNFSHQEIFAQTWTMTIIKINSLVKRSIDGIYLLSRNGNVGPEWPVPQWLPRSEIIAQGSLLHISLTLPQAVSTFDINI